MNSQQTRPFYLLMADDSEADIDLFKLAMKKVDLSVEFSSVNDGEKLIQYLKKKPPYEHVHTPDLVLLDLNMPNLNGIGALKLIKNDPLLKIIPIIMLTSSDNEEDILTCYKENVNSCLIKPVQIPALIDAVSSINQFWVRTAKRPPNKE